MGEGLTHYHGPTGRIQLDNNVIATWRMLPVMVPVDRTLKDTLFHLNHNTLIGDVAAIQIVLDAAPDAITGDGNPLVTPLRLQASANIFDGNDSALSFQSFQPTAPFLAEPGKTEEFLRRLAEWRDEHNLYADQARLLRLWVGGKRLAGPQWETLADWQRLWALAASDSQHGRVNYQGGDLHSRLTTAPEKLTPDDFRLRPDSAGYRAGPDGKDLGADVNLVGPGAAYERWKKTPEYQAWLKDTGQQQAGLNAQANAFSMALTRIGEQGGPESERQRIAEQCVSSDELFHRIVELRPQDFDLWAARAHYLAEQGQWQQATACFRKRLELGPDGAGRWQCYAIASLAAQDFDGYRRVCKEMLDLFSDIPDPQEAWWAAWPMTIAPHAVEDQQKALRMAERAMTGLSDKSYSARAYAAGLYRLGRLEESIACWDGAAKDDHQEIRNCLLAMAHHRLGHAQQALKHGEQARSTKTELHKLTPWYRRVYTEQLIQEMETVLAAEPDATTPEAK
jgi:tetratricopeptide (TPR) repeat protein